MNPNLVARSFLNHEKGKISGPTQGRLKRKAGMESGDIMIHPFQKMKIDKIDNVQSEVFKLYCEQFVSHAGAGNCTSDRHAYRTKCTYMMDLSSNDETASQAVALLQAHAGRSVATQKEFLLEWERNALVRVNIHDRKRRKVGNKNYVGQRKYLRPFSLSGVTDGAGQYCLCKNGYKLFMGIGNYTMKSIEKAVKDGGLVPAMHGLKDKESNARVSADVKASMKDSLEALKGEAEPHASKCVRLVTGIVLKEDDDNIELPSSYTKRGVYSRWCWSRGWDVRPKGGNGGYGKLGEYAERKFDEYLWPAGSEAVDVCSFASFIIFWQKYFKILIIKKSSHDTCGVCYSFSNLLYGLKRREVQAGRRDVSAERLELRV